MNVIVSAAAACPGDAQRKPEGPRARLGSIPPVDLSAVLLEEHNDVIARRKIVRPDQNKEIEAIDNRNAAQDIAAIGDPLESYLKKAHECGDLNALCLSGGGIRSAAFALGVIQGLAKLGILDKIDRLSTVSGGGYAGGYLTAWVHHKGYSKVTQAILPNRLPDRHSPLAHLRRYSRYLAPRAGIVSTDFLTLITLYFRNLLLNWLVILPFIAVGVISIKALAEGMLSVPTSSSQMLVSLATMFAGWALLSSLLRRPGWEVHTTGALPFAFAELLPMLLGAICGTIASYCSRHNPTPSLLGFTMSGGMLAATVWLLAYYFANFAPSRPQSVEIGVADPSKPYHVVIAGLAFATSGVIVGAIFWGVLFGVASTDSARAEYAFLALGPAVTILALFAGDVVYAGLTSYAPWSDQEREWLARSGGRHGLAAAQWGLAVGTILFGPIIIEQGLRAEFVVAAGGTAGLLIAILGKASKTAAVVQDMVKKTLSDYSITTVLAIAVPVFCVCFLALTSWMLDVPLSSLASSLQKWEGAANPLWGQSYLLVGAGCLSIGLTFSCFVNINRFSLHNVYRNRLSRTFLGASNPKRNPSPETDFDESDNFAMSDLWPAKEADGRIPPQLLYVNMSLNVVRGKELAWQERKALPFTASPRYVGCGSLCWIDSQSQQRYGCYRPANRYASATNDKGITLGTAMTISGAAASPNMGYHSSPALSLLLTLFNVRLGAWLANPGPAGSRKVRYSGPVMAAGALFQEALGLTDEARSFVYLSDGGHFENLGVYEMIRRRCRYIIVSDASCDRQHDLEDLGGLVRKVSIDFGVELKFFGLERLKRRGEPDSADAPIAASADIIYPELPGWPGKLLYIKACYRGGSEPASVRSYAKIHLDFPHEPTSNQFFGESQFEAYRALGLHQIEQLADGLKFKKDDIASFMNAIEETLRR